VIHSVKIFTVRTPTSPFRSVKIHAIHVFQLIDAFGYGTLQTAEADRFRERETSLAIFRFGTYTGARKDWSLDVHERTAPSRAVY